MTGMHPKLMAVKNNQPLTKYFKVFYCCRCKGLSLFLQQSHSLQHLHFAEIAAFKLYAFTANSKAHAVHTCFGRQMHMATYYKVTPLSPYDVMLPALCRRPQCNLMAAGTWSTLQIKLMFTELIAIVYTAVPTATCCAQCTSSAAPTCTCKNIDQTDNGNDRCSASADMLAPTGRQPYLLKSC